MNSHISPKVGQICFAISWQPTAVTVSLVAIQQVHATWILFETSKHCDRLVNIVDLTKLWNLAQLPYKMPRLSVVTRLRVTSESLDE